MDANAVKGATLKSFKCINGPHVLLENGYVENVTDSDFVFTATDSRGNVTTQTISLTLYDYIKLTCSFTKLTLSSEGTMDIELAGLVSMDRKFDDSNQMIDGEWIDYTINSLQVEYRYAESGSNEFSAWRPMSKSAVPNSYTATKTVEGLDYQKTYTVEVRAYDAVMEVTTSRNVSSIPIFDWGSNDFRFNIPVTIMGGDCYGVHILSDTTTDGVVTLEEPLINYKYIEIFYTDNNNRGYGMTKIPIVSGNTFTIDLSLVEASSNNSTYIRRTAYICKENTLSPVLTAAGYALLSGSNISHSTGTNYLKVIRVVGYK
jgi:hypothetical protein